MNNWNFEKKIFSQFQIKLLLLGGEYLTRSNRGKINLHIMVVTHYGSRASQ